MNKALKAVAIAAGVLVGTYLFVRVTKIIQVYTISSPSSSPTINPGDFIYATNLKKPERDKFIAYRTLSLDSGQPEFLFHRIAAIPGDKLEIRRGVLYVNDQPAPDSRYAQVLFHVHVGVAPILQEMELAEQSTFPTSLYEDSMYVYISASKMKELTIYGRRVVCLTGFEDDDIQKIWKQKWNIEDFGPIKLPPDKYFVLGDNRYRSVDSRYLGYVDRKDILGVVLGNF